MAEAPAPEPQNRRPRGWGSTRVCVCGARVPFFSLQDVTAPLQPWLRVWRSLHVGSWGGPGLGGEEKVPLRVRVCEFAHFLNTSEAGGIEWGGASAGRLGKGGRGLAL